MNNKKVFDISKEASVYIAGHQGMVGSALVRLFNKKGYQNLILRSRAELDLMNASAVAGFFQSQKPDIVILAASRVGGIKANMSYPAEFIFENLTIQNNVIHQSYLKDVKKFCFLGSSCIYPRQCPQPMKEDYLLSGPLEPTNEAYALAKIAGLKMIEYYHKQYGFPGISVMPCNLYGTKDSFDAENSHVLSALIKKFVDAIKNDEKTVTIWGSGKATREFMHVDDAAVAIILAIENYEGVQSLNIGCGEDISIFKLASMVAELTGYKGRIDWDHSKPDGMLRKCLDTSRINELGFALKINLRDGIRKTIEEYMAIVNEKDLAE